MHYFLVLGTVNFPDPNQLIQPINPISDYWTSALPNGSAIYLPPGSPHIQDFTGSKGSEKAFYTLDSDLILAGN